MHRRSLLLLLSAVLAAVAAAPRARAGTADGAQAPDAGDGDGGGSPPRRALQPIWQQSAPMYTEADARAVAAVPLPSRRSPSAWPQAPQPQPQPQRYAAPQRGPYTPPGGGALSGGWGAWGRRLRARALRDGAPEGGGGSGGGSGDGSGDGSDSGPRGSGGSGSGSGSGRRCVVAFDFDFTLRVERDGRQDLPALDAAGIIRDAQSRGLGIAIASANSDFETIRKLLQALDGAAFSGAFLASGAFQIGASDKAGELRRIAAHYGTEPRCVALLDDTAHNKQYADRAGAVWAQVDGRTGVRWRDYDRARRELRARCGCS